MLVPCHGDVCLQYIELQHHCLPFPPWPFAFQLVPACKYIYPEWFPFAGGDVPQDFSLSVPLPDVFIHEDDLLFCPNATGKVPSHYCHWELEDKIQRHLWMSWK